MGGKERSELLYGGKSELDKDGFEHGLIEQSSCLLLLLPSYVGWPTIYNEQRSDIQKLPLISPVHGHFS